MKYNSSWMKASLQQPTSVLCGEYFTTVGLLQQNEKSAQIFILICVLMCHFRYMYTSSISPIYIVSCLHLSNVVISTHCYM